MHEQCAFCPNTANLTGEHIWSRWIGDLIDINKFLITQKLPDGRVFKYPKKKLNIKAKVVCGDCNSGWMSDLENNTKPFLQDMILFRKETVLMPSQIALLSAVSFKNAVVADHMQDNSPRFFPFITRQRFGRTLRVPNGVQMWTAALGINRGIFRSGDLKTKPGFSGGFEINIFNYAVGYFAVQVNSSRWKRKTHRRNTAPPRLTQNIHWNAASVPFWPPENSPFRWPPLKLLGDDTIDEFCDRWQRLEIGPG
ncbi:MAG TPA: hypothetical protein VMH04_24040 [Candidatus Solibacter sp.]|nr:hypothetical protein [Candidatus Solibacter sp.]